MNNNNDVDAINNFVATYSKFKKEISKIIIGQDHILEQVLMSIFCNGHCLLVGVPGLAKTLLVKTIAKSLGLKFNRIQFTPDLMPSDIVGSEILNEDRVFNFIKGPLFGNIILADEINRTPPKTQSALLESMQERSVTASGKTYNLDLPFFVLATQNPIEQEGTYPLPEAQSDRFMFNIILDYPSYDEELRIVKQTTIENNINLDVVMSADEIINYQKVISSYPYVILMIIIGYALHMLPRKFELDLIKIIEKSPLFIKAFFLALICWTIVQVSGTDVVPFIYFQF